MFDRVIFFSVLFVCFCGFVFFSFDCAHLTLLVGNFLFLLGAVADFEN